MDQTLERFGYRAALASIDETRNRHRHYEVHLQDGLWSYVLVIRWGRLGRPLRERRVFCESFPELLGELARLLRLRVIHGYKFENEAHA